MSIESPNLLEKVSDKIPTLSTGQKAAAAGLGAVVAAAAGIAVRQARKGSAAGSEAAGSAVAIERTYHLKPDADAWELTLEGDSGSLGSYATKEEGLEVARAMANENQPSELVIHLADGSEQKRHRYGVDV